MGCFSMPKSVPDKRYTPEFKKGPPETDSGGQSVSFQGQVRFRGFSARCG